MKKNLQEATNKIYTEIEVESMIAKVAQSLAKLKEAYSKVINDPETSRLIEAVYHKLYNLRSIKIRKSELKTPVAKPSTPVVQEDVKIGVKASQQVIKKASDVAKTQGEDADIEIVEESMTVGQLKKLLKESISPSKSALSLKESLLTESEKKNLNEDHSPTNLNSKQFEKLIELLESSIELFDTLDWDYYSNETGLDIGELSDYYLEYGFDTHGGKNEQQIESLKNRFGKKKLVENSDDIYFGTYSAALQHVLSNITAKGFNISEQDWDDNISVGPKKPSRGETVRLNIPLVKIQNGEEMPTTYWVHIQVYNRETNDKPFELNFYFSKESKRK